jgi:hypothetical protein
VDDAVSVHIGAGHEKVSCDARGGARGCVYLCCDGILDLLSCPYPDPRLMLSL